MLIDLPHQADMPPRLAYRRGRYSRSVGQEIALTGPIALGHANSYPLFLAEVLFSLFFPLTISDLITESLPQDRAKNSSAASFLGIENTKTIICNN